MCGDDDDEIAFEEWDAMSDAQQDAALERAMKEYSDGLDRMTPQQLYRYRRNRRLDLCLKQRRLIREFPGLDTFRNMLRATQRRLVEARIEYRTGAKVGHS